MGLNFKLDASTLSVMLAGRLLSVIRQTFLIANAKETAQSWIAQVNEKIASRQSAYALAV